MDQREHYLWAFSWAYKRRANLNWSIKLILQSSSGNNYILMMERTIALGLLLCAAAQAAGMTPLLKHVEEWQMWKMQHGKSYDSVREELERHLVWLANREYINVHNKNSHIFGFTLAMNHLGDLVSLLSSKTALFINCLYRLIQNTAICT